MKNQTKLTHRETMKFQFSGLNCWIGGTWGMSFVFPFDLFALKHFN